MGLTKEEYLAKKATKKAVQRTKHEHQELITLSTKYRPRPYPINAQIDDELLNSPGLPFLTLDQMIRLQALKIDYAYKVLRDQGLSHDEAEEKVFPEAYAYRKEQEANTNRKEAAKERNTFEVPDGLDVVVE